MGDPDLTERLKHLWKRSEGVGFCEEVRVSVSWSAQSESLPQAVPLRGSACGNWSTLGGDSRSFAQVLKSHPQAQMSDRGAFGGFGAL